MRIGIDSYSYHRFLGEVRPGEEPANGRLGDGAERGTDPANRRLGDGAERGTDPSAAPADLIAEMIDAGAEVLSLETVFLPPPGRLDAAALVEAAAGRELVPAWGHPYGLRWGADAGALEDLLAWIGLAPALGAGLVRCVAAHPALRNGPASPRRLETTARALRRAVAWAGDHGVVLALENHADLDGRELQALLDAVPGLMLCLDTANAVRVGDDPVTLARAVAPYVAIVHLKDVDARAADPRSVPYGTGIVDLHGVLDALMPTGRLPVCVELARLGPGVVDERALVRQCVAWLARERDRAPLA